MKYLVLLALILGTTPLFSQDIILLKDGSEIQAKVLEITDSEVKYKKFDFQDGPSYSTAKSQVFMITYQNGQKDVFGVEEKTPEKDTIAGTKLELFQLGQRDAKKFYRGGGGAVAGTVLTSIFATPLIGLIPAAATSSSPPKLDYSYPNAHYLKNPHYYSGYSKQAHKIKKKKVWTGWGVGFGLNLMATIVLIHQT